MFSRNLFTSLLALSSLSLVTYADETECGSASKAMRTSIRHIEGKGVGYTLGYTSFDLFLASSNPMRRWVPFFDGRAHVFNNGQPAVNAGVGARYLTSSWVYGVNILRLPQDYSRSL